DQAPEVVSAALVARARVAGEREAEPLARFYRGAPRALVPLALTAFAAAAPAQAVPALEDAALAETSPPQLRAAARSVLEGEQSAPSFAGPLARLFERELRRETANALARVPDGGGLAGLVSAARRSPDALDRAATALALGLRRFDQEISGRTRDD